MQYEIPQSSQRCCVSNREIRPGETFYSVVLDTLSGLERRDYAKENWTGPPEDALGFWRSRVPEGPVMEKRPKTLSVDMMWHWFEQLEDAQELKRQQLRYVLALLLIRRRALKLQSTEATPEGSYLVVSRPRSTKTIRVLDPDLSEQQIQEVQEEVTNLMEQGEPESGQET